MQTPGFNHHALWLSIIPVMTMVENVLVLMCVVRHKKLRKPPNYFMCSLAASDISVAVFVMPFAIYSVYTNNDWLLSTTVCDMWLSFDIICCTASILNLSAISMDRYLAVSRPIRYCLYKHSNEFLCALVVPWVLAFSVGAPIALGANDTKDRVPNICRSFNLVYTVWASVLAFFFPCLIMLYFYLKIFCFFRKRVLEAEFQYTDLSGKTECDTILQTSTFTKADSSERTGSETNKSICKGMSRQPITCATTSDSAHTAPAVSAREVSAMICHQVINSYPEEDKSFKPRCSLSEKETHLSRSGQAPSMLVEGPEYVDVLQRGMSPRNHDRKDVNVSRPEDGLLCTNEESQRDLAPSPDRLVCTGEGTPTDAARSPNVLVCTVEGTSRDLAPSPNVVVCTGEGTPREEARSPDGMCSVVVLQDNQVATSQEKSKSSMTIVKKRSTKMEKRALKTLVLVVVVFLICWLPYFIANLVSKISCILMDGPVTCNMDNTFFVLTVWLGYINSTLNPIIFGFFHPEFKKALEIMMFGRSGFRKRFDALHSSNEWK